MTELSNVAVEETVWQEPVSEQAPDKDLIDQKMKEFDDAVSDEKKAKQASKWYAVCHHKSDKTMHLIVADKKTELKKILNRKTFLQVDMIIKGVEHKIKEEISF